MSEMSGDGEEEQEGFDIVRSLSQAFGVENPLAALAEADRAEALAQSHSMASFSVAEALSEQNDNDDDNDDDDSKDGDDEHMLSAVFVEELFAARCQDMGLRPTAAQRGRFTRSLRQNRANAKLVLTDLNLGEASAAVIARHVRPRGLAHTLAMARNALGDEGAVLLAHALPAMGVGALDVRSNALGPRGCAAIAETLPLGHLRVLDLSSGVGRRMNRLGLAGGVALSHALAAATTALEELRVSCCGQLGVSILLCGGAAMFNDTLRVLDVAANLLSTHVLAVFLRQLTHSKRRTSTRRVVRSSLESLRLAGNAFADYKRTERLVPIASLPPSFDGERYDIDAAPLHLPPVGSRERPLLELFQISAREACQLLVRVMLHDRVFCGVTRLDLSRCFFTHRLCELLLDSVRAVRAEEQHGGGNDDEDDDDNDVERQAFVNVKQSIQVRVLSLAHNTRIGTRGATALGRALALGGGQLRELSLEGCGIGECLSLARALRTNTALEALDLSRNSIGDATAAALAAELLTNTHLARLSLAWNAVHEQGALPFAAVIRRNRSLKALQLEGNEVSDAAGVALVDALKVTPRRVLTHLDLSLNHLTEHTMLALEATLAARVSVLRGSTVQQLRAHLARLRRIALRHGTVKRTLERAEAEKAEPEAHLARLRSEYRLDEAEQEVQAREAELRVVRAVSRDRVPALERERLACEARLQEEYRSLGAHREALETRLRVVRRSTAQLKGELERQSARLHTLGNVTVEDLRAERAELDALQATLAALTRQALVAQVQHVQRHLTVLAETAGAHHMPLSAYLHKFNKRMRRVQPTLTEVGTAAATSTADQTTVMRVCLKSHDGFLEMVLRDVRRFDARRESRLRELSLRAGGSLETGTLFVCLRDVRDRPLYHRHAESVCKLSQHHKVVPVNDDPRALEATAGVCPSAEELEGILSGLPLHVRLSNTQSLGDAITHAMRTWRDMGLCVDDDDVDKLVYCPIKRNVSAHDGRRLRVLTDTRLPRVGGAAGADRKKKRRRRRKKKGEGEEADEEGEGVGAQVVPEKPKEDINRAVVRHRHATPSQQQEQEEEEEDEGEEKEEETPETEQRSNKALARRRPSLTKVLEAMDEEERAHRHTITHQHQHQHHQQQQVLFALPSNAADLFDFRSDDWDGDGEAGGGLDDEGIALVLGSVDGSKQPQRRQHTRTRRKYGGTAKSWNKLI